MYPLIVASAPRSEKSNTVFYRKSTDTQAKGKKFITHVLISRTPKFKIVVKFIVIIYYKSEIANDFKKIAVNPRTITFNTLPNSYISPQHVQPAV